MASSAASRVIALGALTAAGQLVIVGSLPAYSQVFDPATYGEYLIFVGAYTVLSVFAGIRYDSAIVLPRSDALAAALSALVLLIAFAVAVLIALTTVVATTLHVTSDRPGVLERDFGYGLAVATALGAAQRCLAAWCVRNTRFLLIGWAQFAFCLVTVVSQLSFSTFMPQQPALIWGYVCALAVQTLCLSGAGLRTGSTSGRFTDGLHALKVVALKYRRFPTYMVGYALASSARDRLIQIALGIGAGAAALGRFGLAYRVIFAPNSLIYSAVSPVFFGIASRGSRPAVGRFAAGLVETLFVALVVPYVAFAIEAPVLTDAVLSQRWHGTGPYLQALAAPALMLAATCWLDRAFDSFRRQNVAFSLEASFTIVSVTSVACLAKLIEPIAVAWAFGVLGLIYYWIYFLLTFVACKFELAELRHACGTGVVTAGAALVLGLAVHQIPEFWWRLPAYAAVMTGVVMLWMRLRGGLGVLRMLLKARVQGRSDSSAFGVVTEER